MPEVMLIVGVPGFHDLTLDRAAGANSKALQIQDQVLQIFSSRSSPERCRRNFLDLTSNRVRIFNPPYNAQSFSEEEIQTRWHYAHRKKLWLLPELPAEPAKRLLLSLPRKAHN